MPTPLPDETLDRVFRAARSYNGYKKTPVTEADVHAIFDLMKWGPTSANQEPARFVWCLSQDAKEKLAALSSSTNADKIRQAPATVIIAHDLDFHEKLPFLFPHADAKSWFTDAGARQQSAFRNGTLQGGYFIVAARMLGFDVGPMSGFDNGKVDAEFFSGTTFQSNFIATLGVGDPASIFERLPRLPFEEVNRIA